MGAFNELLDSGYRGACDNEAVRGFCGLVADSRRVPNMDKWCDGGGGGTAGVDVGSTDMVAVDRERK